MLNFRTSFRCTCAFKSVIPSPQSWAKRVQNPNRASTAAPSVIAKMFLDQEELDELVWDKSNDDLEKALVKMRLKTTCLQVEKLVQQKFTTDRAANLVSPIIIGGFNVLYRIHLEGSLPDVIVRRPCANLFKFPQEKTSQEAATANWVAKHTDIPTPQIFFFGDDPILGLYIILEFVENSECMSDRLKTPTDDLSIPDVLNPSISEDVLKGLWVEFALYLLRLSMPSFPRIGSPSENDTGAFNVASRPLAQNMNTMLTLANIPRIFLPQQDNIYETAGEWYIALAEIHMVELVFQQYDLVASEDDCRNKYVAGQIFRWLARQGRLTSFGFSNDEWSAQSSNIMSANLAPAPSGSHSFRLWGDDFRPGNILVNNTDDIATVIDWEFTYSAPMQFSFDPPWWLLLERPETWDTGIADWETTYNVRLVAWLSAVKEAENCAKDSGAFSVPLSRYMRESWETGRFWLNYAARRS
jgi:hypothetical protein